MCEARGSLLCILYKHIFVSQWQRVVIIAQQIAMFPSDVNGATSLSLQMKQLYKLQLPGAPVCRMVRRYRCRKPLRTWTGVWSASSWSSGVWERAVQATVRTWWVEADTFITLLLFTNTIVMTDSWRRSSSFVYKLIFSNTHKTSLTYDVTTPPQNLTVLKVTFILSSFNFILSLLDGFKYLLMNASEWMVKMAMNLITYVQ